MSKPANTSLIGAFVLGGILLLVVGIGLFGAGRFGAKKLNLICYFEDSVNGLDIGSLVKFKGVTIGKVTRLLLRTPTQGENDNAVPVIIEIDEKLMAARGIVDYLTDGTKRGIVLEEGLRARLQPLSIITGQLYVELDIYPGTSATYHQPRPPKDTPQGTNLMEVPTLASNLGTLMRATTVTLDQFSRIPFRDMGEKMNRILAQVEEGIGLLDFAGINTRLMAIANSLDSFLKDPHLQQTPATLHATMQTLQTLGQKLADKTDPLARDIEATAAIARETLEVINQAGANLRNLTQPGAPLPTTLQGTLRQLADTAYAVRTLAQYLQRHPNALVAGKPSSEDRPAPPLPQSRQ
ncbi:MAG: MlaD family protein [Puniceicoccales bacterium]|jgi:paraquat-inducible protein B|nr:MlaD family protein [Puniceicoccales bacterium]